MKDKDISHKDLTKQQLIALKELYIENRISQMSVENLKKFVKEVLELQVKGTVGNQEEGEAWKEMKEYFQDEFHIQVKLALEKYPSKEIILDPEEEDFKKRLELVERRKKEEKSKNEDMWDDE